uniref:Ig-like domain-containing protein n=1 Tax=Vombatus ursinus TaxID=29139 RepID=A0A4X2LND0_VOMUR
MEKPWLVSLLMLCLHLGWVNCQQKVTQTPPSLSVQEEESITINCTYSESNAGNFQWYRQDSGKGLTLLFHMTSGKKQRGRFRSTSNLKESHSSLHITGSQLGDSATYLCATEPQQSPGTCSLCKNTVVGSLPI